MRLRRLRLPPRVVAAAAAGAAALLLGAVTASADNTPRPGDVLVGGKDGSVRHFDPSGKLLGRFGKPQTGRLSAGMCLDSSRHLYSTEFSLNLLHEYDSNGKGLRVSVTPLPLAEPESCVLDRSGHIFIGQAGGAPTGAPAHVLEINPNGSKVADYAVQSESRGSDWIDLGADQCTLFYTSEGPSVKRYDICKHTQLADLANGLSDSCYAVRERPNSEVMVACRQAVFRLAADGHTVATYPATSMGLTQHLFAMTLDPDGTTFWTGDTQSGDVARVDVDSGRVITRFNAVPPDPTSTDGGAAGITVYAELTAATVAPAAGCSTPLDCWGGTVRTGLAAAAIGVTVMTVGVTGTAGGRLDHVQVAHGGALAGWTPPPAPVHVWSPPGVHPPAVQALGHPPPLAAGPAPAAPAVGGHHVPVGGTAPHQAVAIPGAGDDAARHAGAPGHHGATQGGVGDAGGAHEQGHEAAGAEGGGLAEEAPDKLLEAVDTSVEAGGVVEETAAPPDALTDDQGLVADRPWGDPPPPPTDPPPHPGQAGPV